MPMPKGSKHSAETRRRMSEQRQGHIVTAETRAKIAASKTGVPKSAATLVKMSAARLGKRHRPESCAKMSASRRGVPKSAAHVAKMSAAATKYMLSGKSFAVKGFFEAQRATQSPVPYRSNLERRLMWQFDLDENVKEWTSPVEVKFINKKGQTRHALPDFLVKYSDGSTVVVEAKGVHLLGKYLESEKFSAVRDWCRIKGYGFAVVVRPNHNKELNFMWVNHIASES